MLSWLSSLFSENGGDMWLFVGLGNPGDKHAGHRHNIGFMAIDEIHDRLGFSDWKSKYQGLISEGVIEGEKVMLLKPQTYMNLSGRSVSAATRFFKIPPEKVFIFYDELDLEPGKLRVKQGGGAAGHNGIRSIDGTVGKNTWRVRLGIGHPGDKERVTGYVLNNFSRQDQDWLPPLLWAISDEVGYLVQGESEKFMSKIAEKTQRDK